MSLHALELKLVQDKRLTTTGKYRELDPPGGLIFLASLLQGGLTSEGLISSSIIPQQHHHLPAAALDLVN